MLVRLPARLRARVHHPVVLGRALVDHRLHVVHELRQLGRQQVVYLRQRDLADQALGRRVQHDVGEDYVDAVLHYASLHVRRVALENVAFDGVHQVLALPPVPRHHQRRTQDAPYRTRIYQRQTHQQVVPVRPLRHLALRPFGARESQIQVHHDGEVRRRPLRQMERLAHFNGVGIHLQEVLRFTPRDMKSSRGVGETGVGDDMGRLTWNQTVSLQVVSERRRRRHRVRRVSTCPVFEFMHDVLTDQLFYFTPTQIGPTFF